MRLIRGLVRVIVLASVASAAIAATGPIGYWPLDEGTGTTAADASANGNTGTLTNSPTWVAGKVGNALSFPGTTPYVSINGAGNLANLYTTGMTATAWIKPNSAGASGLGRVFDKDNSANTNGWWLQFIAATTLRFQVSNFPTTAMRRDSTATIAMGTWQHVAVVWDGTTNVANMHIYINGVLADASSQSGAGAPQNDSTLTLAIGNRAADGARGFDGIIDEARIYNRVLSLAEIQAIANDAQAPTAPAAPAATAASSSQINVSWTASTDNVGVTAYLVERCLGVSCTNFVQVASVTASPYSNSGLVASTTYRYRMRATDAAGLLSGYSTIVSATTPASGGDTTPPTAPAGLTTTAISSSQINLGWTASTDLGGSGVTAYLIERCAGAGCATFALVATVTGTPPVTTFADTGLTASTSYSYRARARDAAGNVSTAYSNVSTAVTPTAADTTPPTAPTNLTATPSAGQMSLSWGPSSDLGGSGVAAYLIERCAGAGCTSFALIATLTGTPPVTNYTDTGLTANTAYSYRVKAQDVAGNVGGYSNTTGSAVVPDCD